MNDHFHIRELTEVETSILLESLITSWEVTNNYWYPLKPVEKSDVIAFNADEFENRFGFHRLREILKDNLEIYEIREWKNAGRQINPKTFEPQYDGEGEGYWFPKDMKWIVYCSHENSITFGGEEIIQLIKKNWNDWFQYTW